MRLKFKDLCDSLVSKPQIKAPHLIEEKEHKINSRIN